MAASPSPSPDDERVPIGSILDGRYRIDALLGSGGMGRVYRGEHTGIGRQVAIKVLHADLNRNREAAARFHREALASGRLDHPNIVGVSDFGVLNDGAAYLVMEVLDGESLGDRIGRDKAIQWREALEILRGVLNGLRHAHERGVVHRDIKPDNVYLARKGKELVVKILDFGIAKLYAGTADDPASTRAGLTVGTPAYLSPEQAVGGEILPASDIYSATVVLFEMLTGRAPFEDKDPLAMLGAHVSRTPPTLLDVAPDLQLPPGIEEMIQRGLVKTQADRIPSATDYLVWIDAIFAAAGPPATGSAPAQLGVASTETFTPIPDGALVTPVPSSMTPVGAVATASPSLSVRSVSSTPVAGTRMGPPTPIPTDGVTAALEAITVPGALDPEGRHVLPPSTRAVSLADAGPIPKRWIIRGAIGLGSVIVLAIILAIAARGGNSKPETAKPGSAKPGSVKPTAKSPEAKPAPVVRPAEPDEDEQTRRTKLNALLYELEKGKDCPTRKAAIPRLVELGDPAAIPGLRAARYRMRGGVLGIGDENTNWCLTKDADAAIKLLAPPPPPPPPPSRR